MPPQPPTDQLHQWGRWMPSSSHRMGGVVTDPSLKYTPVTSCCLKTCSALLNPRPASFIYSFHSLLIPLFPSHST